MNRTLRGRHNGASVIVRFAMLLRSLVSPLAGMTLLTALAGCASTSPSPAATFHVDVAPVAHPQGETPQWWYRNGAAKAAANGAMQGKAKNVIVFLGDGMSLTTVAAARIFEGQRKGMPGEENLLSWEHFPHTAFSKTYNTDSQTPDSAGTMTAIASGVKSHMGAIGVSAGHKGECTPDGSKDLLSWLTLVNDNNQSFINAELMAVAGRLRVTSDYRALSDPPNGKPLRITCFPIGSTARGSPDPYMGPRPVPPPPPPPPMAAPVAYSDRSEEIVLTGSRISRAAMVATEEDLADLKLYRVPEPVTVAAQSQKQIAFLERDEVKGKLWHTTTCTPWALEEDPQPARLVLATVNDARSGLGVALPTGGITVFESMSDGELLVGEERLRDYASGQDVDIALGASSQVTVACSVEDDPERRQSGDRVPMRLVVTNANPAPAKLRLTLGGAAAKIGGLRGVRIKDGARIYETSLPANGTRELRWTIVNE